MENCSKFEKSSGVSSTKDWRLTADEELATGLGIMYGLQNVVKSVGQSVEDGNW